MMSTNQLACGVIALAVLMVVQCAFAGPDWVEDGDAGSDTATAQPVTSPEGGAVERIFGTLNSSTFAGFDDFEDVYQILVTDPTSLSFSTVNTSTTFQTSLWLFDSNGFGLLGNIFAPDIGTGGEFGVTGSLMGNMSTDGTEIVITTPGIYYIAISSMSRQPFGGGGGGDGLSSDDEPIFNFEDLDEVSGPDGPGGNMPLTGWFGAGSVGSYELLVTGVSFIPAPGALPMLALGLLGAMGRRRQR